jgi:hypothetical protein
VVGELGKDRDEFSWLLCTNRQSHEQERLMLTQIIAGDALAALGRRMHEARAAWGIPQNCTCFTPLEEPPRANGICKVSVSLLICALLMRYLPDFIYYYFKYILKHHISQQLCTFYLFFFIIIIIIIFFFRVNFCDIAC